MKNWNVTIDFKAGISFETEVKATSGAIAKVDALRLARGNGFTGSPKNYQIREVK